MKLILATQNEHKVSEFRNAPSLLDIVKAPAALDVDENADSFIGNACLKARAYADHFKCNAIADDSGLCVDALNGAPGIFSARFAALPPDIDNDPDHTAANNRKLLRLLENVPQSQRTAHFVCALYLVFVQPDDIRRLLSSSVIRARATIYDENRQALDSAAVDVERIAALELAIQAQADGTILMHQAGCAGFGYDPLFYCPATHCTFAELTQEQKLAVSHRGCAIAELQKIFAAV